MRRLANANFVDFKDQVIFERDGLMTQGGKAFSVFAPDKNAWLKRLAAADDQARTIAVAPAATFCGRVCRLLISA